MNVSLCIHTYICVKARGQIWYLSQSLSILFIYLFVCMGVYTFMYANVAGASQYTCRRYRKSLRFSIYLPSGFERQSGLLIHLFNFVFIYQLCTAGLLTYIVGGHLFVPDSPASQT